MSPVSISERRSCTPWCRGMNHATTCSHPGRRSSGKKIPLNRNMGVMNPVQ
jgi:hypothetical protein